MDEAKTEAQKKKSREEYAKYRAEHKYIAGSATFPYGLSDASSLRKTHNKICDEIKLPHPVTPHGLRHSAVTFGYLHHCTDPDFDLATFAKRFGHSVRTMMETYAHLEMAEHQNTKRDIVQLKDF